MSKYVNKAWLRLESAKSQSVMHKYNRQVIRLSYIDVYKHTQKDENFSLKTMSFIWKNKHTQLHSFFCIKGGSLHIEIDFKSAENYLIMIDSMVIEK